MTPIEGKGVLESVLLDAFFIYLSEKEWIVMRTVPEYFGSLVFDDRVMKARLPYEVYTSLKKTIDEGGSLNNEVANAVADAMKDWAVEHGATHFTHWFQPLTGITAEKHDSFIAPSPDGGVIMEFSGKELIQGEPDASSFPSGGLRATFEARGYTAWDPTSYAFIKDKALCIPTAFCSYGGEALDKKTPLLRSMQALNKQALRVLHLFGNEDVKCVRTSVGPEQEYFLVDREMFDKRKDLTFCGRTLFGAKPPKGQEMDDHYFGAIKPRVAEYMADLNEELWKLGILAKTEHNEVAPAQHELAPIYTTTNVATDHNQLTMEIMQKVAARHGLVCLLHEKPFEGVNGSGKHNNWSMATDTGVNLLTPGETPYQNAQFLLFLCAVIQAVDDYQDLLRLSVATAGNDHRLGANEAPPAVVSIFLGDELTAILDAIEKDEPYSGTEKRVMKLGVHVLPKFIRDTTDRNRTSPFAFTGNRFEFRMVGSADSIAAPNTALNTVLAEAFCNAADALEGADDFEAACRAYIKESLTKHKRIIFNGDGYSDEWVEEAARRGLPNIKSMVDAIPALTKPDVIALYEKFNIFTKAELESRAEVQYENYVSKIGIEAKCAIHMAGKHYIPAGIKFSSTLAQSYASVSAAGVDASVQKELLERVSALTKQAQDALSALITACDESDTIENAQELAQAYLHRVVPAMAALRAPVDELELIVDKSIWPVPTYGDLMFEV